MKQEKILIESKNGNKLNCIIAIPEKVEGLIVSSQGFGSTTQSGTYQFFLEELPKAGFIIVIFEFQGLGESEGDFKKKSASRDLEDLKAVVDYAYNNFEFKKDKFFIFGSSFGGLTALNFALEDQRVKALVLRAPVSDIKETYSTLKQGWDIDYDNFMKDGEKYDIYPKLSKVNIPVKIIHGDKDESVSLEQSKKLIKSLPNAELEIIEGEGHRFEGCREEIFKKIIRIFKELK